MMFVPQTPAQMEAAVSGMRTTHLNTATAQGVGSAFSVKLVSVCFYDVAIL